MASVTRTPESGRWRVRWYEPSGSRRTRRFATEDEARIFATSVGGASTSRGPKAAPLTTEGIKQIVRQRTSIDGNGCWIWTASGGSNGYAQMTRRVAGRVTAFSMHRLSYEAFVGPIPEGLHLDHICVVPKCVNPNHLEPVTPAENNRRRSARIKMSGVSA